MIISIRSQIIRHDHTQMNQMGPFSKIYLRKSIHYIRYKKCPIMSKAHGIEFISIFGKR